MSLAKLTEPRSINPISRPRLFRLLDQAENKPVTWVWAPPGSGKTTLVGSYLTSKKLRTLWFQMDSGDNDLATFFYYLGLGAPKRKRPMAMFTPEYQMGLPIFTRNFFRELFGRLKPPFALVFDNYQEIDGSSPLHEAIQGALAEVPTGGRVIFISRSEAPAPFAGLRARQLVEVIDWEEIRFTRTEVNELVKRLAPGSWPTNAIDQLYVTADGWVAGLVLLLEQLRKDRTTTLNTAHRSAQVMFDYFAGEIFKRTDAETREVLLQTAFLPSATVKMAKELTGIDGAGDILAGLHKQNYFTNRRPGSEPIYDYHPLFWEFLRSEARRCYSKEQLREVRRKAADLLENMGYTEAAVPLLQDAQAWQKLTDVICRHAPTLAAQGRIETLEQWISGFPDSWVDQTPWLLLWRGVCRAAHFDHSPPRDCENALSVFRRQRDPVGAYLAWATIVTRFVLQGAHDRLLPWSTVFDELRSEFPKIPNLAIENRVAHAAAETLMYRLPIHPELEYWVVRSMDLARQQNDLGLQALSALTWWRYYCWMSGDHCKAGLVVDAAAKLMNDPATPPFTAVAAGLPVAMHQYLRADSGCRATVAELLRRGDQLGLSPPFKNLVITVGLASALSDGDVTSTGHWLDENKQFLESPVPALRCHGLWTLIWAAFVRHDTGQIKLYLGELLNLKKLETNFFWRWLESILLAISFHRLGDSENANAHLHDALAIVAARRSPYMEFTTRLTQANILFDQGQETEGLEMLRIAMALGKAGDYVTSEIWIPAVMARLCAEALKAGIEVEYVRMLVRKRNLMPEDPPVDIEAWPWPIKIYTLGEFQILKNDQPLTFSHKVQKKPLALLKAIIALGGSHVYEETVLDLLWPDADGDAAAFALNSAVHRLRKLLENDRAITRQDNKISLDRRYCWVDVWAVERLVERSRSLISGNGNEEIWAKATELLDSATKLFRGPFLNGDPDLASSPVSDGIRRGLLRQFSQLGQHWEWKSNFEQAATLYEQALAIDPCAENFCRKLMSAYHKLGRPGESISIYNALKTALHNRLGIQPSMETEATLKRLMGR